MFKKKEKQQEEKPDLGKYVNTLPLEQLEKSQKLKTIFMLLSTLFFAISLFLPVEGRTRVSDIIWLSTAYVIFDILLIVVSVYVSYQGYKKHRVKQETLFLDAPKGGFKAHTYVSIELFNVMHIALFGVEIAVASARIGVWGIINIFIVALSAAFGVAARQFIYRANAKTTTFFPPITPDQEPDVLTVEEENVTVLDENKVDEPTKQENTDENEKPKKL